MNRRGIRAFASLFLPLLLIATGTAPSGLRATAQKPVAAPAPITIPFEMANRHIILKVSVNRSRPLSFVLDTGDKYAIINLELARELGVNLEGEVRMQGAGSGSSNGAFVRNANFTVAGLDGFSQPITLALPIGPLAPKMGQDFDGIIGHDFIKNFVVEIDYQKRVLKLHDKDRFTYTGPGESLPIKINGAGHPIVEAQVTPVSSPAFKGKFVVDIGSGLALALHSPTVAEHRLPGANVKTIKSLGAAGAGGAVNGQIGRVAEVKLGSYAIKNPITFFAEDRAGAFASSSLLGNIGAQVMNRFRVFLDYNRERIIIEPNSDFEKPFDRAFAGMSVEAEGKDYRTFRIKDVLESSPAAELQLQKDDVIAAIDGRPAEEFTLTKLNEMFERPVEYALTIKRKDQTLKIKLKPRRLV